VNEHYRAQEPYRGHSRAEDGVAFFDQRMSSLYQQQQDPRQQFDPYQQQPRHQQHLYQQHGNYSDDGFQDSQDLSSQSQSGVFQESIGSTSGTNFINNSHTEYSFQNSSRTSSRGHISDAEDGSGHRSGVDSSISGDLDAIGRKYGGVQIDYTMPRQSHLAAATTSAPSHHYSQYQQQQDQQHQQFMDPEEAAAYERHLRLQRQLELQRQQQEQGQQHQYMGRASHSLMGTERRNQAGMGRRGREAEEDVMNASRESWERDMDEVCLSVCSMVTNLR
jgi:hypothetical protein